MTGNSTDRQDVRAWAYGADNRCRERKIPLYRLMRFKILNISVLKRSPEMFFGDFVI